MKLYLAGPMTGYPEHNFPEFARVRQLLRLAGHEVVCPAESCTPEEQATKDWQYFMKKDIKLLLDCEAVALLDNWESSRGARLETHVAREVGMDYRPYESYL